MNKDIDCPVCKSSMIRPWCVSRTGWQLYRCLACTHRFANMGKVAADENAEEFRKRMTHGAMPSDQDYYRYLAMGETLDQQGGITAHHILAKVVAPGTWLDIGCGSGFLLAELVKAGFSGIGVEPGGWGQIAAQEKKITVVQGFLDEKTFKHRFDFVSATDVLEHQPLPLEFLHLVHHYLASGGKAFLSFPCADAIPVGFLRGRWNMLMPPTHCQFFTRNSFRVLCARAGLEVMAEQRYGMHWMPSILLRHSGCFRWLNNTFWPRLLGDQLLATVTASKIRPA